MANLVSPGVAVSVIDESAYGAGSQGTVPLIILASKSNKANVSGSGFAEGTIPANANKPYLLTSQRELVEKFGVPKQYKIMEGANIDLEFAGKLRENQEVVVNTYLEHVKKVGFGGGLTWGAIVIKWGK